MANATAGQVQAALTEARGRAMSTGTWRLRWQLRRLPQHTSDQLVLARRRAIRDELHQRGDTS